MTEVFDFVDSQKDRILNELIDFLKIPSVSSQPEHAEDVKRCGEWVASHLKSIGMEEVRVADAPAGHPVVYGQWLHAGPNAPTVLIYGHYDVQPVDPVDLWDSPPFEPVIKNGKIIARGTADDKGQVFCHFKAVETLLKIKGKLPVNVKFVIEGEEESGGDNLTDFINNNAELLACDVVLISDTEWYADGMPSICYALRGISFVEITVTGPNRDLHSGSYGGGIDNPLNTLCWMVSQLRDKYGRITIPGFYDNVLALTDEERKGYAQLPFDEKDYAKELGVNALNGEFGFTTLERVWARPTLDLNGIYGGYTGEGAKTIIPSKATAKISMRLVPNQKTDEITNKVKDYILKLASPTVTVDIKAMYGGNPVMVARQSKGVRAAIAAYKSAFGKDAVFMREGGSIPIVELFDTVLKAPTVLMGFGLPTDNIHSPNENYSLNNFFGGIKTSAAFLEEFSKK